MQLFQHKGGSAQAARARLVADQALRPANEQRAALEILGRRLEYAGRDALMQALVTRVRADPRLKPALQKLLRTMPSLEPGPRS